MYRAHGAPELQREDVAVDVLCERIARFKRRVRLAVVLISVAAAFSVLLIAAATTSPPIILGGRAIGVAFATALFGALFGTHEIGTRITLRVAERWARDLAAERRCDLEPLLDAARLLAGRPR